MIGYGLKAVIGRIVGGGRGLKAILPYSTRLLHGATASAWSEGRFGTRPWRGGQPLLAAYSPLVQVQGTHLLHQS